MKRLFTLPMVILLTFSLFSQAPQKMSYQAVIRDAGNNLVTSHAVGMRISILQGSATGTEIYKEIYNPNPQTNANGLVSIEIGGGIPLTGTFSTINWAAGPFFLKTETDPTGGTNYTITGTSQLLSVPYALYSATAQTADYNNLTNQPNLSGYLTSESDPVFAAFPAHGITNGNITNWNSAYSWGNHAGLYRSISWVPAWTDVTGKPNFATVATSGSYNDLTNKPTISVSTDATLSGNGTTTSPLKIAQQAAISGQVLKWNGSAWNPGNDVSGGSLWIQSGSDIYYNAGKVGIGTSTPGAPFNVYGSSDALNPLLLLTDNGAGSPHLEFTNTIVGPAKNWAIGASPDESDGSALMNFYYHNGTVRNILMSITGNGNVGIGTQTPEANLQIWGNSNTLSPQLLLSESEGDYARLSFKNMAAITKNWSIAGRPDPTDANSLLNFWYWNGTTGLDIMSITGSGKVGIGNVAPDATLDVAGTVQIGSSGKIFSEIREITGTTGGASTYYVEIAFPSGYTKDNTRVLSGEVNFLGSVWHSMGMGLSGYNISVALLDSEILLYYPDDAGWQNKAFRILLMKVQ
jgi:hypothetical protein